jgi:hypothetical protein
VAGIGWEVVGPARALPPPKVIIFARGGLLNVEWVILPKMDSTGSCHA